MIKWTSILLAVVGFPLGIWAVAASSLAPPDLPPDRPPPLNPYPHGIAAAGVVEASSRNVRLAAPESGPVVRMFADVNDAVKAQQPLFQLDEQPLAADLARARAAAQVAQQNLKRLLAPPRVEDVALRRATLTKAQVRLDHARREKARAERLRLARALSEQEMSDKVMAFEEADAAQAEAKADLDRLQAGSWEEDVQVARCSLAQAEAEALTIRKRLDRLTVRAPLDGVVLKRYLEPGEFAVAGTQPVFVVGEVSKLHVRAQVDERDAPLLRPGARAIAQTIGQRRTAFPLAMLRIEPLAVPKTQLSGANAEVVDTRVVEVLFRVEALTPLPADTPAGARLFPGQVVDVFIDGPETPSGSIP